MITIDYLSSAFIGVLFGSCITVYLYRNNLFRTAKYELIEHLRTIIHDIRYNQYDDSIIKLFNRNIVILQIEVMKLQSSILNPYKKNRLGKEWDIFMGRDHCISNQPGIESMNVPLHEKDAMDHQCSHIGSTQELIEPSGQP